PSETRLRRWAGLDALIAELASTARGTLAAEGYPPDRVALRWSADLRYLGQSFELTVPLLVSERDALDAASVAALVEAFGEAHERAYGHRAADEPVELVNVRLAARGLGTTPRRLPGVPAPRPDRAAPGGRSRRTYFGEPLG